MKIDYSLYLVADTENFEPTIFIDKVQQAITAGVSCVQLRSKTLSHKENKKLGQQLKTLLKPHNIPLIINDDVVLAKEIDADGVHVGQSDMPYHETRKLLGYDKIIGLSIENIEQAHACKNYDVDYFGVGPIYHTNTKKDIGAPLEITGLQIVTKILPKPLVAIGGININNLDEILQTNVAGIAVVSAIMYATQPAEAAKEFNNAIANYRRKAND